MLQTKDIKNLRELTPFSCEQKKSIFFTDLTSVLKLGKLHAIFSATKQKGVSGLTLIKILLSFSFLSEKNVHDFISSYWIWVCKLTQEQLANKVGTKKSYISRLENGKCDIQLSTLYRIFEFGLGKQINLLIRQ
ncbi:MAG: helix-turn-helix domain-containing protein [Polaribacter sp.]